MRIRTGPPTTGDDFFDRKDELVRLTHSLAGGSHILLTAPRRVGKTSLVLKTLETLRNSDTATVFSNVEAATSEAEFIRTLLADLETAGLRPPIATQILDKLAAGTRFLGRLRAGDTSLAVKPDEWLDELFIRMLRELTAEGRPLVWAVDELPYFLHRLVQDSPETGLDQARHLLHWMRRLRQPGGPGVVWLFSGSVGLDNFADRHGLAPAVNDLTRFSLGAFSPITAREFLQKLGADNGIPLDASALDHTLDLVGWLLPYHLQLIIDALQQLDGDRVRLRTATDIDAAYAFLLRPEVSAYFDTWWQRLNDQLETRLARLARQLLTETCRRPEGSTRADLLGLAVAQAPDRDATLAEEELQHILLLLERDGYLARDESGRWVFRSFLLRDYWRRRAL